MQNGTMKLNGEAAVMEGARQDVMELEAKRRIREGAGFIKTYGLPVLIYAVLFPFCLYRNDRGIATLLFFAATIALLVLTVKRTGRDVRGVRPLLVLIGLIGGSVFLTDNSVMIFLDYVAVFLLTVSTLVYAMADVTGYSLTDYLSELVRACFGAVGKIFSPFADLSAFIRMRRDADTGAGKSGTLFVQVIAGLSAGVVLVAVLGSLLGSADVVFRHMINKVLNMLTIPDNMISVGFYFVFALFSSYCGIRYFADERRTYHKAKEYHYPPLAAICASAMVAVLYLVFSVTQIAYLFIGGFKLPGEYTYAQYAREGFFQLLFVCVLNLVMVLLVKKYFTTERVLKVLLTVISLCTYIMIASSAMRMWMYVSVYALTFTRVFVFVALFTLAVLFAGVIVMIYRPFNYFRYGVVAVGIIFTLFTYSHSEYFIARYNLARATDTFRNNKHVHTVNADLHYLSDLSSDAAPAIAQYAKDYFREGIRARKDWYQNYLIMHGMPVKEALEGGEVHLSYEEETLRQFNVSHFVAVKVFE